MRLGYWAGIRNNSFAVFAGPNDLFAATIWPFVYGNLQIQLAPAKPDFELVWCTSGNCSGVPSPYKEDVAFYIQGEDPPRTTTSLTPQQIRVMQLNALNAFKLAFAPYNVHVGEGRQGTNTVYVVGDDVLQGCGETPHYPFAGYASVSWIYYVYNMQQAQYAVNETDGAATSALLQAIGEGIGNNAAHEIAHELVNEWSQSGKVIGGMGLDND